MAQATSNKRLTVKDLREYLDNAESGWTEEDKSILGKFEDIPIYCNYFNFDNSEFLGIGAPVIHYDGTVGFIMEQEDG